jgi:hypothetical protein
MTAFVCAGVVPTGLSRPVKRLYNPALQPVTLYRARQRYRVPVATITRRRATSRSTCTGRESNGTVSSANSRQRASQHLNKGFWRTAANLLLLYNVLGAGVHSGDSAARRTALSLGLVPVHRRSLHVKSKLQYTEAGLLNACLCGYPSSGCGHLSEYSAALHTVQWHRRAGLSRLIAFSTCVQISVRPCLPWSLPVASGHLSCMRAAVAVTLPGLQTR